MNLTRPATDQKRKASAKALLTRSFYTIKPLIPRFVQIYMRRKAIRRMLPRYKRVWPIDESAASLPEDWRGWPEGKTFAVVLTHDVDTALGRDRCLDVARMEEELGFRSSFNFVPLRYATPDALRRELGERGFEVGIHGLYHDGKYLNSREIFSDRAKVINSYIRRWNAAGFRMPAMHHRLEWFHELNIEYDASTYDTDPFEPYTDPLKTIFPLWIPNPSQRGKGYVELPYTLCQDFTLFILLQNRDIDIWKRKLEWIAQLGGMVLINVHPDYMYFGDGKPRREEYPAEYYRQLLLYLTEKYGGQYWHALPKEVGRFWAQKTAAK